MHLYSNSNKRRELIISMLKIKNEAISASALADHFQVSRQVIVGDIAILRASGEEISATTKGYIYIIKDEVTTFGYIGSISCRHTDAELLDELYLIVDYGGTIIDVTVNHPVYGRLMANVNVSSRHEADQFLKSIEEKGSRPLCNLTDGIHLHNIGCNNEVSFNLIKQTVEENGFTFD